MGLVKKTNNDTSDPLVGNDRYEGYIVDLLRHLGQITQTSYVIRLVADGR